MSRIATLLIALAVVLGAVLAAAPAQADGEAPLPKMDSQCVMIRTDFTQTGSGWKVQAAIDAWRAVLPDTFTLVTVYTPGCADVWVHRYPAADNGEGGHVAYDRAWPPIATDAAGRNVVIGADVWLNDYSLSQKRSTRKAIVAHEIGHALGLDHNTFPSSIMSTVSQVTVPQPVDARNVVNIYAAAWSTP